MNEPYREQVLWKMMHEDRVYIVSRSVRQDVFLVWNCDFVKFLSLYFCVSFLSLCNQPWYWNAHSLNSSAVKSKLGRHRFSQFANLLVQDKIEI